MNRQVGAGMSEGGGLPAPPDGERMEIDLRTASAAAGAPAAEHSGEQMHEQPQPQQGGGPALGAIQEESEISTTVKPSMSGENPHHSSSCHHHHYSSCHLHHRCHQEEEA